MLFDGLIDDAALFPPGNAAMPAAVRAHARHAGMDYAPLVGRFLCPAARLPECAAQVTGPDARLGIGVIAGGDAADVEAAMDFVARTPRLVPQAVEIALPRDAAKPGKATRRLVAALPELPAYVEVARQTGWRDALDALAESRRYAKLRTGGPTPQSIPPAAGVAAFVVGCVERSLPFKCTAGLHHAVRWQDPTLGWHHGFLNILGAVAAALQGASSSELVDVLEQTSTARAVAALPRSTDEVHAVREAFHGFGSCSIVEPVEDLQRLGLVR